MTDFEFATFSSISVNYRGGTFNYAAPELFKKDKIYDFKPSDVGSFCVMLYSITVGHYPWEKATYDCEVFTDYMCNPNLLLYDVLKSNIPVNHKVKYMKILKRGFNLNHNERINMNEIVDILNNK